MSVSQDTDRPEVVRATPARSGSWGRHILWVLIISTLLAALALFGSWAFNVNRLSGEGGMTRVEGAAPTAPSPVLTNDTNPATPGR